VYERVSTCLQMCACVCVTVCVCVCVPNDELFAPTCRSRFPNDELSIEFEKQNWFTNYYKLNLVIFNYLVKEKI